MKKLLICGDSFGELAHYSNHLTNSNYAEPILGGGWQEEFKHWCELLADDVGMQAVSHSIGGAGISSSSFVAFQQLLNHEYGGIVFFVSHHGRSIVQRSQSLQEWQTHVQPSILFEQGTPDQIYNPDSHQLYKTHRPHYHRSDNDTEIKMPQLHHLNCEEIAQPLNDDISINDQKDRQPNDSNYLMYKAAYSYTHDSVTALIALKTLCDAKGIPLIIAAGFSGGICDAVYNMGMHIKFFKFYELEHQYNFEARDNYPSHYNADEHQIIYEEFKQQYPEYRTMFTQNN